MKLQFWLNGVCAPRRIDPDVTSDHPFISVPTRDGHRSHAAHHFGDQPPELRFSDGVTLRAEP